MKFWHWGVPIVLAVVMTATWLASSTDPEDSWNSATTTPACSGCGQDCGQLHPGLRPDTRRTLSPAARRAATQQTRAFREWLHQSATGPQSISRGLALAKSRRAAMELLIREDPDAALEQALGYAEYAALPEPIRELVEQPFSTTGELEVLIGCGDGVSELHHALVDSQGQRLSLSLPAVARVSQSKRGLPLQGIRLDGHAVVRGQVFEVVEGADAAFVEAEWPAGQADPGICFDSGKPIRGEGVTAVAGGRVFHFQDLNALAEVESVLHQADSRPGIDSGSSWLMLAASSQTESFPEPQFAEEILAATYATTTGAKTALFILVDFSDAPGQPVNPVSLEQSIDVDVNDALARYSHNQTSMDGTVTTKTYRAPRTKTYYVGNPANSADDRNDELHSDVVTAYLNDGNSDPFAAYDTVAVVVGDVGFKWAGLAAIGGQKMWIQNSTDPLYIVHEFGHNYGLAHASYWQPNSTNPVDPGGTNEEYGDAFDNMGSGNVADGHFQAASKVFLGWIPGSDWQDLADASDNGTYRVHRFDDQNASGNRALRIAKSASADHYWIGYRNDYSGIKHFANGVCLTWERASPGGDPERNRAWLIDTTPGSADGKNDAPITLGRTYTDAASNVHITPVAKGGSGATQYLDVTVNFGAFPSNAAPTATLLAPAAVNARETQLFSVEASDGDGDPLAYAWDFGDGVLKPNAAAVAHNWIQGGSYNVSVTVSDMKGGRLTLQQTVTVTDPLSNWTARTSGTGNDLLALAHNGTHIVAVGGGFADSGGSWPYADGSKALRSFDGTTWNNVSTGVPSNASLRDICWTGSEFLAVGEDYDFVIGGWEGVVYKSIDGSNWELDYQLNTANTSLHAIISNGAGVVVAVGNSGTVIRRSGSGGWSSVSSGVATTIVLRDVAYGSGVFACVGHNRVPYNGDPEIRSSTDGLVWTDRSSGSGLDSWQDFRTIHHTGQHFVAGGWYSRTCHSLDAAQTWQSRQTGDRHQPAAFATGAGLVYAVGVNNDDGDPDIDTDIDLVSTNGQDWTTINPGALNNRNGLAFFKDTFISVGNGGSIRQSGAASAAGTYQDFADLHYPGGGNNALGSANPDGDWANNLAEYGLGGDPTNAASAPARPRSWFDSAGHPVLEITRSRRRSDVAYTVWWSTDLINWTRQGLTTDEDSNTTLRVIANGQSIPHGKGFLKLELHQ